MSIFDSIQGMLGFKDPCPQCGETLNRQLVFTLPVNNRLRFMTLLLRLGSVRQDDIRPTVEEIIKGRMETPEASKTGVRAHLEFCRACKFGALDVTLLKDGKVKESKRHAAGTTGYETLDKFLEAR